MNFRSMSFRAISCLLMKAQLRPSLPEDRDFLFRLYASTRMEELRGFRLECCSAGSLFAHAVQCATTMVLATYSTAENQIIEKDHEPIGRMIVQHEARHMAGFWIFPRCPNIAGRELAAN